MGPNTNRLRSLGKKSTIKTRGVRGRRRSRRRWSKSVISILEISL
jgi:hypothetical protein